MTQSPRSTRRLHAHASREIPEILAERQPRAALETRRTTGRVMRVVTAQLVFVTGQQSSIEPYREHTSVQDARRLVALDRAGYVDAIRHRAPCSDQLGHILRRVPHSIERHKPTGVLIPQRQPKRREAPPKCNDGCAVKHRILIVALLEIVVRNSRAEMVHVMEANASRDPL